jgi:16S rRNA (cytidine1402-2'-O)-methyltransferase
MLYIISTPIGNLKDITLRALEVMSNCFYILCEDTRTSNVLLKHYNIKTSLKSFHKFNEIKEQNKILSDLKENKTIGLISDAGTPLISDPGYFLIKKCFEENIKIEAIPGPSSVIQALVLSGFESIPFQFVGFLPKKPSELDFYIKKMLFFDGTSIAFETANRINHTIEKIVKTDPKRNISILKELTKKFEMRISMEAEKLLSHLQKNPLKGEIVIVIEKGNIPDDVSIEDCVTLLQSMHGLSLKEAIEKTAKIKKISKKPLYKIFKVK